MLTMLMDLGDLASAIDATCRIQGQFTLRSGITTTEYFDKYLLRGRPGACFALVVDAHRAPACQSDTQVLGGLELGCVPIATTCQRL